MISNALFMLIAFVLALAPLVFFHELGHFLAAKRFGVGVPVFSLGFGPRLFGFRRKETDYRISLIPLGGYVRMSGDEADEHRSGASHEFLSKPRWQRFVIFVAGAAFNLLLAFLVMWLYFATYGTHTPVGHALVAQVEAGSTSEAAGLRPGDRILAIAGKDVPDFEKFQEVYLLEIGLAPDTVKSVLVERDGRQLELQLATGSEPKRGGGEPGFIPKWEDDQPAVVTRVQPDEPAMAAGFRVGDRVLEIAGRRPISRRELILSVRASAGKPLDVTVLREGREVALTVVPRELEGRGLIGLEFQGPPRLTLGEAASKSLRINIEWSKTLFVVFKRLGTRELPLDSVSGPIGIAEIAQEAIAAGFDRFLFLLAFLSLQLGILNLLPIPVLDGGHIMILLVESVMRRELSERLKERVMQAGLAFLILLMAYIIFKDVGKLI